MKKSNYQFTYSVYNSSKELNQQDAYLLQQARSVAAKAYAPYSQFRVGAAALLKNGEVILGTNQENASYPVGICAERTLLSSAATLYPNVPILTLAVSYIGKKRSGLPISPCGMCRQALQEFEDRTKHPIRLILAGQKGKVFIIERSGDLLPLAFKGEGLK